MDWISAHFECSLDHALLVLRERVKADIEQWRKRVGADPKIHFTIDGPRTIITKVVHLGAGPSVSFERSENCILVYRAVAENKIETAKLIPTVNAEGQCRLRCDDKDLEFWQTSRLILEGILFG